MPKDPFREARQNSRVLRCPFQGEEVPMLLRHTDVRAAAKNWQTFSSDAPFRVPIPSEEKMRTIRQLPIETDPPLHGEYRKIVEPFFKRAQLPEVIAKVEDLIDELLSATLKRAELDIVSDFALPIQSRALTYLLDVPESEAETYLAWGIHVFHGDNEGAPPLESYLENALQNAAQDPGSDFFSALHRATFQGRPLTHAEKMGFANLTFAGGRDTIIHSISSTIHHFAEHPEALASLSSDPRDLIIAGEEIFRAFMPLTHIGRVCPVATEVKGEGVPAHGRISLGWAAANFDEEVFAEPESVKLDRKPNPHVSFGFGPHLCLGAPHARLIIRTLLRQLKRKVDHITLLQEKPHLEKNPAFSRENGFESLRVRLVALKN